MVLHLNSYLLQDIFISVEMLRAMLLYLPTVPSAELIHAETEKHCTSQLVFAVSPDKMMGWICGARHCHTVNEQLRGGSF